MKETVAAGELRHRVTFQDPIEEQNPETGDVVVTGWTDTLPERAGGNRVLHRARGALRRAGRVATGGRGHCSVASGDSRQATHPAHHE